MKKVFFLVHRQARDSAASYCMSAPDGYVVMVSPPGRSNDQNEKFHSMITEIATQCRHQHLAFDVDTWKRLLVDQFRRDTYDDEVIGKYWREHPINLIPSLDGSGMVALGEQTRRFPRYVASGFIEWLYAWGSQNGAEFN